MGMVVVMDMSMVMSIVVLSDMVIMKIILKIRKQHQTTISGRIMIQEKIFKKKEQDICYRFGVKCHLSYTCHTPKHLADIYQALIKAKGRESKLNFVAHQDKDP